MSSYYVRNLAEQWAMSNTVMPFYPSINVTPEPNENLWLSLDFESFGYDKETYCDQFVESGEIRLMFFGRVGVGYNGILPYAESCASEFYLNSDPAGKLYLTSPGAPVDYAGQHDPWFIIEIPIEYEYRQ